MPQEESREPLENFMHVGAWSFAAKRCFASFPAVAPSWKKRLRGCKLICLRAITDEINSRCIEAAFNSRTRSTGHSASRFPDTASGMSFANRSPSSYCIRNLVRKLVCRDPLRLRYKELESQPPPCGVCRAQVLDAPNNFLNGNLMFESLTLMELHAVAGVALTVHTCL